SRAARARCAALQAAVRSLRARLYLRTTGSGPRTWRQSIEAVTSRQCSRRMAGTFATGCEDTMLSDNGTTALRPAAARRAHENDPRPALARYATHQREAA